MKHLGCGRCSSRRLQHPRRYRAPRVRSSCNRYRSAFCLREGILYNIRESRDQAVAMRNGPSRKADPGQTRVSRGTFFSPVNLKTMNITKSVLNPRRTKTSIIGQVSNLTQIDAKLKQQLLNADSYVKKNINASNYPEFQPLLNECINIVQLARKRPIKQKQNQTGGSSLTVDIVNNIRKNTTLSPDQKVDKLLEYVTIKEKPITTSLLYGTFWLALSVITNILLFYVVYGDDELTNANYGQQSPIYKYTYHFTRVRHEIARRKMGTEAFVQSKLNLNEIEEKYVNILSWLVWSKTIEKAPHYIIIIRFLAGFDDQIDNTQALPYFIQHQVEEINRRGVSMKPAEMSVVIEYYHRLFYFKGYPLSKKIHIPTTNMLAVFYLFAINIQHKFASITDREDYAKALKLMENKDEGLEYKNRMLQYYTQSEFVDYPRTRHKLINIGIPTYLSVYFQTPKLMYQTVEFSMNNNNTVRGIDIVTALTNLEHNLGAITIPDVSFPLIEQKITDAIYQGIKDDPDMVRIIMTQFAFKFSNIRSDLPTNRVHLTPIERIERIDQPRPPQMYPSNTQPPRPPPSNTQPRPPPSNNWDVANAAGTTMGAISSCAIMGGAGGKRARVAHTGPNGGKYYLDEKTGKKTYIRQNKKVSRKKKTVR